LIRSSEAGAPLDARIAAISTLGQLIHKAVPAERARIFAHLDTLANEDNFRVRMALVGALQASEAQEAIPILAKIKALDSDGRVKRNATVAMDALATSGSAPESVSALKSSLDLLREDFNKLKSAVEEMKGKASPRKSTGAGKLAKSKKKKKRS
jgi:hypothetical protein